MPKKTLERNKDGGWSSTSEPLPSEIAQKNTVKPSKPKASTSKATVKPETKPKVK